MKWASALSGAQNKRTTVVDVLQDCAEKVKEQLQGDTPNLVVAFVHPHFIEQYDKVPDFVLNNLAPTTFIGCSAAGLIGGGFEVEQEPAVAMTAAVLPGVEMKTFHLVNADLPDLDDPPQKWENIIGIKPEDNPNFILLPDPFSFKIDDFVQGLDFAFPAATKIGGLSSGARRPGQNALFINDRLYRNGMVGAALYGDLVVETIVAQGCRPIGKPLRVSKSNKNFVFELNGKPAMETLQDMVVSLTPDEQRLAQQSLFIGIAMDEFRDTYRPGDFLIRNIIGIEPTSGALVVSELVRDEQTIQFHVRDAATSADDLRLLLKQYRDSHQDKANGALLFSCLGRGMHLYGTPNHDSECFREYMGPIPLGGFFCNGEIGQVGGTTFLHGYTSSFGIFRPKTAPRS